jgi:hypothetical protein
MPPTFVVLALVTGTTAVADIMASSDGDGDVGRSSEFATIGVGSGVATASELRFTRRGLRTCLCVCCLGAAVELADALPWTSCEASDWSTISTAIRFSGSVLTGGTEAT